VATEHTLQKIIGDNKVCIDFKILKVKVSIISFGTRGRTLLQNSYLLHDRISSLSSTHNQIEKETSIY
jgi:hypothetical protein